MVLQFAEAISCAETVLQALCRACVYQPGDMALIRAWGPSSRLTQHSCPFQLLSSSY